ncbi:hypothetical protein FBUS_11617 [Fasciolopsis buskii]|uniref:Uncharacterized protein n=1 Tax=Fasciolopsis buskii TaxID=27845 RepID=A0A8E0VIM1_9TREM|nr:hypothetical protein FBUS_11617 [Fasciolopsis buski]
MTAHYTKWYVEHLIKHAYADHFVYSPLLKSFVTMVSPEVVRFRAEDFADLNELRALAELIGKYRENQLKYEPFPMLFSTPFYCHVIMARLKTSGSHFARR